MIEPAETQQAIQLAVEHYRAGRLKEAEAGFRQVISSHPRHAPALHQLGVLLYQTQRAAEAAELIEQATRAQPDEARYHCHLGAALAALGRVDAALAAYRRAIALRPDYSEALYNLGNLLRKIGRSNEAIDAYRKSIAIAPGSVGTWINLGNVLRNERRFDESADALRRAISLQPKAADAHHNLANALCDLRKFDEAVAEYRLAISLKPGSSEAYCDLAGALRRNGQPEASAEAARSAIAQAPRASEPHNALGNALLDLGQIEQATVAYRHAITLAPEYALPHANLALTLLLQGDFAHGWAEHEWRLRAPELGRITENYQQTAWDGSELHGRTILLHAEQGFGDAIQFVRYVPLVIARGGTVILKCRPPLARLMRSFKAQMRVVPRGEETGPFDVHCPLMSLPHRFDTSPATIPASVPYLRAEKELSEQWRKRLPGDARRVGLAWAGLSEHANDRNRSMTLADLAPLFSMPGITFVSLQKDRGIASADLVDWTQELHDFADTAALIENLDLVITVDTAVAHLAGAMGEAGVGFAPVCAGLAVDAQPNRLPLVSNHASLSPARQRGLERRDSSGHAGVAMSQYQQPPRMTLQQAIELGMQYQQADRLREAEEIYRQILSFHPSQPDALHLLGTVASQAGQLNAAEQLIVRAIAAEPGRSDFHGNLGKVLAALGRYDEAVASFRRALAIDPNSADLWLNLGATMDSRDELDAAIDAYGRATTLQPDLSHAHNNLGVALGRKGLLENAIAEFRKAASLEPGNAQTFYNLGTTLRDATELTESQAAFAKVVELQPEHVQAQLQLGIVLLMAGKPADAIGHFVKAIALQPDLADAHNNLGTALIACGRFDEGRAAFGRAVALEPDLPSAHTNLGMALLTQGDLELGLQELEWRWQTDELRPNCERLAHKLRWNGDPLNGRSVLLHAEQGLGDTIQYVRYIPQVIARGGRVVLECQEELLRLMQGVGGVEKILSRGEEWPPFDVHCPLPSLPLLFGTTVESISAETAYLKADPDLSMRWRKQLPEESSNVGLCWAGRSTHANDRNRSIPLEELSLLAHVPNVRFVSLRKRPSDVREDTAGPLRQTLQDWTDELRDFADTAALIDNLDLVITVDTAIAHLAGAIGKPVWVLLPFVPDWRWMLDRTDSPWYPTMRLFRQRRIGDWSHPVQQVVEELRRCHK